MMDVLTMTSHVDGNILLVGEGDFSFALAMTNKLEETSCSRVIATSIETEESIKKHLNAEDNINQLKGKGVEVRLSTDATKLHTDQYLRDKTITRIIFNFPHSGGKSDLKRNRQLLNDFFASAVNILDHRGHIMVTLCKGQGGTPADKPMREWHDSWQVVSMAANSGFILVKTMPFDVEDYTVYTSTGFRSQDKGFHTDNAVTHVFERAECVSIPESLDDISVTVNEKMLKCPPYLYKKLQQIRMIEKDQTHIIHGIYKTMTKKGQLSFLKKYDSTCDRGFQKCLLLESKSNNNGTAQSDSLAYSTDIDGVHVRLVTNCDSLNESSELMDDICTISGSQNDGHKHRFARTLVVLLDKMEGFTDEDFAIMYGVVFDSGEAPSMLVPPSYHCLFTFSVTDDHRLPNQKLDDIEDYKRWFELEMNLWHLEAVLSLPDRDLNVKFVSESGKVQAHSFGTLHTIGGLVCERLINGNTETTKLGDMFVIERNIDGKQSFKFLCEINLSLLICLKFRIPSENLLWSSDYRVMSELKCLLDLHVEETEEDVTVQLINGHKPKNIDPTIGNLIWLRNRTGKELMKHEDGTEENCTHNEATTGEKDQAKQTTENVEVDVDNEDKEKRFVDVKGENFETGAAAKGPTINGDVVGECTFTLMSKSNFNVVKEFHPPSIYPLTWTHDMSFWENEDVPFDTKVFQAIIRNIAGNEVVSADLIDRFTDPITGRRSRCHRLVFNSMDKSLSYNCSWKLQSLIRLEVEKRMKITLR